MERDIINIGSYTTFKAQFNATIIQVDSMQLSDTFNIEVDFVWATADIAAGNAAFLKVKYFVEDYLHQSIFTHPTAPMQFVDIDNNIVVYPYVPTSDIIAMTLHAKLNAIAGDAIEIVSVCLGSKYDNTNMSYTYSDDEYPALPKMSDWIQGDYYYDKQWWFRSSPETFEHEVDENTDLTNPPEYDKVLDDIEKIVLGELKLKDEGGEVIKINGWKPEIVKD